MRKFLLFALLFSSVISAKPIVTASILPTKYFIEQISGDLLEVNVMVSENANPHLYEPKPKQIKMLEKSDLFFAIGIDYEKAFLNKIQGTFQNLKIIKTQENITLLPMVHHHGNHHHQRLDPHIWLDPILVKIQAQNITNALSEKYPHFKETFQENLKIFNEKLDILDKETRENLSNLKNRKFIVYHPSWGYFAKRYDLEQIAIEIEGKEPKPASLMKLITFAKENQIKVIFVSPQISSKSAQVIANEVNAKVLSINHLSASWLENMQECLQAFKSAL